MSNQYFDALQLDPLTVPLRTRLAAKKQGLSLVSYFTAEPSALPSDPFFTAEPSALPSDPFGLKRGQRLCLQTGLVTSPRLTVWTGASKISVTDNATPVYSRQPANRGHVDPHFSQAARRRLLDVFSRLKRPQDDSLPLFLTLTAPGKADLWADTSPKDWHRMLDTWWKRVQRAFPNAAAIWRLEAQARGAPHFHLVVWGMWSQGRVDDKPKKRAWRALCGWLSRSWWQVWGSNDPDHLKAGTNLQRMNSWRGLVYYVSKYLAKSGSPWPSRWADNVGRLWGLVGRHNLPWGQPIEIEMDYSSAVKVVRFFRKRSRVVGKVLHSCSLRLVCADAVLAALQRGGFVPVDITSSA